jgi:lipopolysaccharide/colanic/teichoic acid biosynthesis glycosyltransferase
VVRRCLDIVLGGLALIVLSLPMLAIALLVRAASPGPALFRQTRLGQHGRPFRMLKFRTMTDGCDDEAHRAFVTRLLRDEDPRSDPRGPYKLATDPRITRFGRLLRRTSLDELPQLINVLRGEMSLVGPRPMLPWEADLLGPGDRERFAVPAGMTGLWQVSGRSALTMAQALELDARYARTAGFLLDVGILARTVWTVLVPRGRAR